jgi:hypothetical protein
MKLLFDQNLSFKLCTLLSDLFPDSKPIRELGLDRSDDRVARHYVKYITAYLGRHILKVALIRTRRG